MKYTLLILQIILWSVGCSAQNQSKNDCWLPEKYVEAMISKDTNAYKYLIPIEGFETPFDDCYILTYKGEQNPIKTEKVIINGKEKYRLLNLHYYINLKYNSKELVNRYSKAEVYISKDKEKLLLEIIEDDKQEAIYFIDRINNYDFKNIKESKEYLQTKN